MYENQHKLTHQLTICQVFKITVFWDTTRVGL